MSAAIEGFIAITALAVGLSHLARPRDWAEAFGQLHRLGRPGAFVNGGINLTVGAAIVAGHPSWSGPSGVLTGFGWLVLAKGIGCLLAPDRALQSMGRGSASPRGFVVGGVLLVILGGWACYCLWHQAHAVAPIGPALAIPKPSGGRDERGHATCKMLARSWNPTI